MSNDWKHGLCGCFNNCGACLCVYFCPCYVIGKDFEAMGDSCLLCGILSLTPVSIFVITILRGKIRERSGIPGNVINDFLCMCCCTLCALVQQHQEVIDFGGHALVMERE